MNKKFALSLLIVLLLSCLSTYSIYLNSSINKYSNVIDENNNNEVSERTEELSSQDIKNKDINSPYDWIKPSQISVYNDRVVIKINNPEWSIFTNTKSMDPVIDSTSNAIEIIPQKESQIHLGDIVAYESKYKEGIVAHRVIDISHDAFGWYARLKGDNNDDTDPGKVRFEQIKRVVVGIIY